MKKDSRYPLYKPVAILEKSLLAPYCGTMVNMLDQEALLLCTTCIPGLSLLLGAWDTPKVNAEEIKYFWVLICA